MGRSHSIRNEISKEISQEELRKKNPCVGECSRSSRLDIQSSLQPFLGANSAEPHPRRAPGNEQNARLRVLMIRMDAVALEGVIGLRGVRLAACVEWITFPMASTDEENISHQSSRRPQKKKKISYKSSRCPQKKSSRCL
ncbi:hypothetical protein CEXT_94051 [Caerostris extrusa]|uniref:Uncharacterized protein n=1 Tax=Caerostris extrusa TaxID=172846 RepID=A0AAV4QCV9_CAEEX|nr:hypothetical protein CEXT_94051 [Caerostris extrusa]